MISLRQLIDPFYPVYKYLNRSYFFFLEKGVIKLFGRPDIAMRCALNQKEVTPESIISNYFQGLFLLAPNDRPFTLIRFFNARLQSLPVNTSDNGGSSSMVATWYCVHAESGLSGCRTG